MRSAYDDTVAVSQAIAEGRHREIIGAMWDEIGTLQFDFLVARGLQPSSYLLDIGCGCLRGGVCFARYLEPGHYFGVDRFQELLDAGSAELAALGLQDRVPRENLIASESFEFDRLPQRFDFALAQSLFTHLPLNEIRLCLAKLPAVMKPGGKFFATYFERPHGLAEGEPLHHPKGGTVTQSWQDPYHYQTRDFFWLTQEMPWRISLIGEWGHPRDQQIILFERS